MVTAAAGAKPAAAVRREGMDGAAARHAGAATGAVGARDAVGEKRADAVRRAGAALHEARRAAVETDAAPERAAAGGNDPADVTRERVESAPGEDA